MKSAYIQKLGLILKNYTDGLGHLVFTNSCLHCNKELALQERYLCWVCWEGLERTFYDAQKEPTILDQLFWNRVEVHHVCALYFYGKGKVSQSLIRALKYDFKAPLGIYLGEHMAEQLQTHPISAVDAIVAVPIHPKKKFARGYNQSELLAQGISNVWGAPILKSIAHKRKHTASQTTNDRFGRWENVQNLFVGNARIANYRHVLIVDDVITTGATLESLTKAIKAVDPTIQISLLSFAFTK